MKGFRYRPFRGTLVRALAPTAAMATTAPLAAATPGQCLQFRCFCASVINKATLQLEGSVRTARLVTHGCSATIGTCLLSSLPFLSTSLDSNLRSQSFPHRPLFLCSSSNHPLPLVSILLTHPRSFALINFGYSSSTSSFASSLPVSFTHCVPPLFRFYHLLCLAPTALLSLSSFLHFLRLSCDRY